MIKNRKNRKGFTLIELLVVIAIIAVLAVVVVLTLNPAELLRQARDSNRLSDFATLKSALSLYATDVATATWMGGMTNTSTIFESTATSTGPTIASSTSAACNGSTGSAGGWGYLGGETVASGTTSRAINGSGWIPVNFTAISSGAPISALPVDPTNSGLNIYTYVGGQTTYKLATKTESVKYSQGGSADVESTDGGNSLCTMEAGTNIIGL